MLVYISNSWTFCHKVIMSSVKQHVNVN